MSTVSRKRGAWPNFCFVAFPDGEPVPNFAWKRSKIRAFPANIMGEMDKKLVAGKRASRDVADAWNRGGACGMVQALGEES